MRATVWEQYESANDDSFFSEAEAQEWTEQLLVALQDVLEANSKAGVLEALQLYDRSSAVMLTNLIEHFSGVEYDEELRSRSEAAKKAL
jgi:hypothetical protein